MLVLAKWLLTLLSVFLVTAPFALAQRTEIIRLSSEQQCGLFISRPVIDYGSMSRGQLQLLPRGKFSPGRQTLRLSVTCLSSRLIKLKVTGQRAVDGNLRYGVHGFIRLRLLDSQLDGKPVVLQPLTPAGVADAAVEQSPLLLPDDELVPVRQGERIEGKKLTARLEIEPVMAAADLRGNRLHTREARLMLTVID